MRAVELAERLGRQAEAVARLLIPRGRRVGSEWRAGDIDGEAGDSLGIHLVGEKAGVWSDFSTGQAGDLIGLWMAVKRLSLRDACREASQYLGIPDDDGLHVPSRNYRKPSRDGVQKLSDEHRAWLVDERRIPLETVETYKLASRGDRLMFPYLRDGELIFAKYRRLPKQFSADGDCEPILFGWQAVPAAARAVIIAEGELDAMAWHAYGFPALSVPTGANGHKWIEGEFERLAPYDQIFLSFDMDEAGQKSIRELSSRLGAERVRAVLLPHKDANECRMRGVTQLEMAKCLQASKTIDPVELRNAGEFENDVAAELARVDEGYLLPWSKTHKTIKLRPGEVSVWAGINGHGKSQIVSDVTASLVCSGVRACVASMEWRTPKWLLRMVCQIGAVSTPTESYARQIVRQLADTLWTFDVAGSSKAERIMEVMEYALRRYDIRLFVIDNLTKCGFADDDYSGQKKFVEGLADFARRTGAHVILVAHMRKGESEDHFSGKFGVKGSGGITDMVATVIEVWRNKAREQALQRFAADPEHFPLPPKYDPEGERGMDAMLIVHKQNANGEEPQVRLWFDKATGQFLGNFKHRPRAKVSIVHSEAA